MGGGKQRIEVAFAEVNLDWRKIPTVEAGNLISEAQVHGTRLVGALGGNVRYLAGKGSGLITSRP